MDENNSLVRLVGIQKSYPGVKALVDVSFDLKPGEVHCLVGENGAGKSTLMKILSGAEQPDRGNIRIGEKTFSKLTPIEGFSLGISTIYQEIDLVDTISVGLNIFLGHEPRNRLGFVNRKEIYNRSRQLIQELGIDIDPDTVTSSLGPANKQYIQIVKALSRNSKILIMDEPGATLNDQELEKLFRIVDKLKDNNIGIIYISHRLNEVKRIGDRVTIIRQGETVSTHNIDEITIPIMIRKMVGRELVDHYSKEIATAGEVVLKGENLYSENCFQDVSFILHRGEILGLAGLVGAGRTELLCSLYGSLKLAKGKLYLDGEFIQNNNPKDAINLGIGMVPEDRREEGLILSRAVDENITLPILKRFSKLSFLKKNEIRKISKKYVDELNIVTPSINQIVEYLSGGNQQKVVLSKWLATGVSILLLDEPTRGVDVGARYEIYQLINELTKQGVSVILASSELPEILGMCDRILVMAKGKITKEFVNDGNITQEQIMEYAV